MKAAIGKTVALEEIATWWAMTAGAIRYGVIAG
jgi:hypothetical protein